MVTGRIGLAMVLGVSACEGVTPTEPDAPSDPTLVFSTFEQHTWGVATAELNGGQAQALPLPAQNQDDYPDISFFEPRWSPDGRYLAYRASNTGTDNWYLVLSEPAGGFKRVLTPLPGYAEGLLWSPRGDRFLYHWGGFIGGRGGMTVQTALVDTLGQRTDFFVERDGDLFEGQPVFFGLLPIADSSGAVPALYEGAWAPDGEHLYLVGTIGRRAWDPDLTARDVELFRVSVTSRRVVERVTRNDVAEWGFRMAPDGRQILITVRHEFSKWFPEEGEYLLPLHGQAADLVRFAELLTAMDAPQWATDSRHITFTRPTGPGGYPEIFLHDSKTGEQGTTGLFGFWPHLLVPDGSRD